MDTSTIVNGVATVVNIGLVGFSTAIAIRLKFAATQTEITTHAKRLALDITIGLVLILDAYLLYSEFSSPTELTRLSLARTLFISFSMFTILILYIVRRICGIFNLMLNLRDLDIRECDKRHTLDLTDKRPPTYGDTR